MPKEKKAVLFATHMQGLAAMIEETEDNIKVAVVPEGTAYSVPLEPKWRELTYLAAKDIDAVQKAIDVLQGVRDRFTDPTVTTGYVAGEPKTPRKGLTIGNYTGERLYLGQRGSNLCVFTYRPDKSFDFGTEATIHHTSTMEFFPVNDSEYLGVANWDLDTNLYFARKYNQVDVYRHQLGKDTMKGYDSVMWLPSRAEALNGSLPQIITGETPASEVPQGEPGITRENVLLHVEPGSLGTPTINSIMDEVLRKGVPAIAPLSSHQEFILRNALADMFDPNRQHMSEELPEGVEMSPVDDDDIVTTASCIASEVVPVNLWYYTALDDRQELMLRKALSNIFAPKGEQVIQEPDYGHSPSLSGLDNVVVPPTWGVSKPSFRMDAEGNLTRTDKKGGNTNEN